LGSSLRTKENSTLSWIFDLTGIKSQLLHSLQLDQSDNWRNLKCPAMVARGEFSKHFRKQDQEEMKVLNPAATMTTIPKSEHWVHADNFDGTVKVILDFLGTIKA
jgi:pimeloyl-ACP methyl ester carboxylesterase